MKKIIVLLLFIGLFTLTGCSSTVKIQNKRVSENKIYEAELSRYSKGGEVMDGKLVGVYYLNLYIKNSATNQYDHIDESRYYIKVYEDENTQDNLRNLSGEIIQVKAKELIPGWIDN